MHLVDFYCKNVFLHLNKIVVCVVFDNILLIFYSSVQYNVDVSIERMFISCVRTSEQPAIISLSRFN